MRGRVPSQQSMFVVFNLEERVPEDHPLRPIKRWCDKVLAGMSRDFTAVALGGASPLDVAARWAKLEPAFVLEWLARRVQQAILGASGARRPVTDGIPPDSVLQRMDRRNLFCYLDTINRLRGQAAGSFNVQLTLEGLLIDWSEGLANCGRSAPGGSSALPAMR